MSSGHFSKTFFDLINCRLSRLVSGAYYITFVREKLNSNYLKIFERAISMTENGMIDVGKCVGSCRKDIAESFRVSYSFAT